MTTSQQTSVLFEVLTGRKIPIGKLAYFRGRLTNRIHELVLSEFLRLERQGDISKAELARRIGRKPEQITRWLGAAGNWTIETLSDLLLAMGCEPTLGLTRFEGSNKALDLERGGRAAQLTETPRTVKAIGDNGSAHVPSTWLTAANEKRSGGSAALAYPSQSSPGEAAARLNRGTHASMGQGQ